MSGRRGLVMIFLLYLAADLSSPMVHGAFEFDPDASLDCARTETVARVAPAPAAAVPAAAVPAAVRLTPSPIATPVVRRPVAPPPPLAAAARDRLLAAAAAPSQSEDD